MPQNIFHQKLAKLSLRNIPVVESGQGPFLKIEGRKVLNFCSNNYLGFANHPLTKKAAIQAIKKYGVGTSSVRVLIGTHKLHLDLEKSLADFKRTQSCLVLTGGYMTNLAAIQTLIEPEDIVISDELNHASIIDAISLTKVKHKFVYPHGDIAYLKKIIPEIKKLGLIKKADGSKPFILIVTDGVFSMEGDLAPLPALAKIADELGAYLMVDDAHGDGILGDHGRGIVSHFHLHGRKNIIEVGTLSKAFGALGGFVCGPSEVIAYLKQKSRQFLFSNSLGIADTAAIIESIQILQQSGALVKKLWSNVALLKKMLSQAGFDLGKSQTPITPLMVGDEDLSKEFSQILKKRGVLVSPIFFPMVAKGKARLRLMPSASHSQANIKKAVEIIIKTGQELKII